MSVGTVTYENTKSVRFRRDWYAYHGFHIGGVPSYKQYGLDIPQIKIVTEPMNYKDDESNIFMTYPSLFWELANKFDVNVYDLTEEFLTAKLKEGEEKLQLKAKAEGRSVASTEEFENRISQFRKASEELLAKTP